MVYNWLSRLGDGLLPQHCQFCHAPAETLPLCEACARQLPWNHRACPLCALPQEHEAICGHCAQAPPPFDSAWSAFRLEAPIQQGVHALKYRAGFLHGRTLGVLLALKLRARPAALPQRLIPVPLYRSRLMRRGYNQALELARIIGAEAGIAVDAGAAVQLRGTQDQIGATASQRRRNLRGAFRVTRDLSGEHVALIDDVMTTGATLAELARACRAAGAARIEAWAVARAP